MYYFTMTVCVSKGDLLSKLQEHKERYVNSMDALKAAWKELSDKYKQDYQEWEAKYVAETLGKDEKKPEPPKLIEDRTDDYDTYIEMVTASFFTEIEMDKDIFDQLWRDNWKWMRIHTDTIHAYACSDMMFSVDTSVGIQSAMAAYNLSV